jgi:hypothetical protein
MAKEKQFPLVHPTYKNEKKKKGRNLYNEYK